MFYKKNLLILGILLLFVFLVAVWLLGTQINSMANRMHTSMVKEMAEYRAELIALDFRRTVEVAESVEEYVGQNSYDQERFNEFLRALVRLDPKLTRIWYKKEKEGRFTCVDSVGVTNVDTVLQISLEEMTSQPERMRRHFLYRNNGVLYWTLWEKHQGMIFGLDISLPALHTYFANNSPVFNNYAYILNKEGILIVHPDEELIGNKLGETQGMKLFQEAIEENKIIQSPAFSEYLLLPVERVYYPIRVEKESWVVVVNVPELVTQEEMEGFHRYSLLIIIITVLVFSILLGFSQYKWRKEYDRRRKLEQEALHLNLQQLKNQINPHFLFNTLNSLSALIGSDPGLAKDFVLRLSKIYRYVLEKRNESLVAVKEEIEFIRHYYFLQKIRFGEHLELEIDENTIREERKIPLMSLQMLVENAIKHNEITRQNPLSIRIYLSGDRLIVENTYRPRMDSATDSLGVGFESINKIYTYCSDKKFEYRVENNKFLSILPLI